MEGGGALRLVRGGGRGGLSGRPAGVTLGSGSPDDEEAAAGALVLGGSWGKGGSRGNDSLRSLEPGCSCVMSSQSSSGTVRSDRRADAEREGWRAWERER